MPYLRNKWELYNAGKKNISDLTEADLKSDGQKKLLAKINSKEKVYVDHEAIKTVFEQWKKPLYFLDFETIDSVFPKYKGSKPNTQITYQFSLATSVEDEIKIIESYLAENLDTDPRILLAKKTSEFSRERGKHRHV